MILYEKTNNNQEDDVKIKMSDTSIYYTMMQMCERMLFVWFQPLAMKIKFSQTLQHSLQTILNTFFYLDRFSVLNIVLKGC